MTRTFFLVLIAAMTAAAQTTLTSTTFAAALSQSETTVQVASATGIVAKTTTTNTILFSGREAMRVVSVSGTTVQVQRGTDGTPATAHNSGDTVYVGPPSAFPWDAPAGACSATDSAYTPRIALSTGHLWTCTDGAWTNNSLGSGTGTGNNCTTVSIAHTALTTAGTTHDVTLGTIPADTIVSFVRIKESTQFACSGGCSGISSMTVSVGRTGATSDYAPAWPLMQTVSATNLYLDGVIQTTADSHSAVARFAVTNGTPGNFGNGTTTNLTAGGVSISYCLVTP